MHGRVRRYGRDNRRCGGRSYRRHRWRRRRCRSCRRSRGCGLRHGCLCRSCCSWDLGFGCPLRFGGSWHRSCRLCCCCGYRCRCSYERSHRSRRHELRCSCVRCSRCRCVLPGAAGRNSGSCLRLLAQVRLLAESPAMQRRKPRTASRPAEPVSRAARAARAPHYWRLPSVAPAADAARLGCRCRPLRYVCNTSVRRILHVASRCVVSCRGAGRVLMANDHLSRAPRPMSALTQPHRRPNPLNGFAPYEGEFNVLSFDYIAVRASADAASAPTAPDVRRRLHRRPRGAGCSASSWPPASSCSLSPTASSRSRSGCSTGTPSAL